MLLQRIEEIFTLHVRSAQSEGRVLEQHMMALFRELFMTTINELNGKINGLGDKVSQLEADVGDLVSKAGGTSASTPAGGGLTASQDQIDSMGKTVDGLSDRLTALVDKVVNGASPAPASTSTTAPVLSEPTTAGSKIPADSNVASATTTAAGTPAATPVDAPSTGPANPPTAV